MLMELYFRKNRLIVKSLGIRSLKRVELFKVIVQDHCEAFQRSTVPTRDQGFFLCGQMYDFLHRLLRRIVSRSCLPDEWDWDGLRSFDFAVGELFSIPGFMQKTQFRAKALKVARSKIDRRRRSKNVRVERRQSLMLLRER